MRGMYWQLGISGTISAFAYRHRETKKNLCRGGRSQGPSGYWLLANIPRCMSMLWDASCAFLGSIVPNGQFLDCATFKFSEWYTDGRTMYVNVMGNIYMKWNYYFANFCPHLHRASCYFQCFSLPTNAQQNFFKRGINIYIKITTAATCFGLITIIREGNVWAWKLKMLKQSFNARWREINQQDATNPMFITKVW